MQPYAITHLCVALHRNSGPTQSRGKLSCHGFNGVLWGSSAPLTANPLSLGHHTSSTSSSTSSIATMSFKPASGTTLLPYCDVRLHSTVWILLISLTNTVWNKSCDCLRLLVLPRFRSRLAREKQRLVPLSELSSPRSVDVPGDDDPWRHFVSPAISCSTSVRASACLPWPWAYARSRAARDDPRDWRWSLAFDTDVSSSVCCSCVELDARSLAISSRSCNALRSCAGGTADPSGEADIVTITS